MAWMIILATIPVGITGLLLEHTFRTVLGKPIPAACFLIVNGLILYGAELLRRRAHIAEEEQITDESLGSTTLIGSAQILALLPGISRSGVTMAAGLAKGLSHRDAARFSFLLATPVILAAGVLKIPDLMGPLGDGVRPQVLAGSVAAGVAAFLAVRFLTRYFETRTLVPFAIYSLVAGAGSLAWLILH